MNTQTLMWIKKMPITYQGKTMKPSQYRRKRAAEMAVRDFMMGKNENPFLVGTGEYTAYENQQRYSTVADAMLEDCFEGYGGTDQLTRRDPMTLPVRPWIEGCSDKKEMNHG